MNAANFRFFFYFST
ncbi:pheST operon leader peptide PheM [Enterobacter cloacae complex sp. ECC445]|nr:MULTISPECIES: pheST operon leader peptide PheM [Enterobacteriaceae]MCG0455446.1 pheST operon leader peptide PheM [Enterobacter cloacae complex sp. ECC445]